MVKKTATGTDKMKTNQVRHCTDKLNPKQPWSHVVWFFDYADLDTSQRVKNNELVKAVFYIILSQYVRFLFYKYLAGGNPTVKVANCQVFTRLYLTKT